MSIDITIATRELSPFEQLVLGLFREGKTNTCVLLALVFRLHFGDADGNSICHRHD